MQHNNSSSRGLAYRREVRQKHINRRLKQVARSWHRQQRVTSSRPDLLSDARKAQDKANRLLMGRATGQVGPMFSLDNFDMPKDILDLMQFPCPGEFANRLPMDMTRGCRCDWCLPMSSHKFRRKRRITGKTQCREDMQQWLWDKEPLD